MDRNAPPLNPLPPVVWLLAAPLIAMEVVVGLGASGLAGGAEGIGWRSDAIQRFAFAPDFLRRMWEAGQWPLDGLMRLVTYPLVQIEVTQTVFVVVFLLALGKFVGEIFRAWAVVAVVIGSSIGAAVIYTAVPWMQSALIGAWPPVYGLIGAFTYILWAGLGRRGSQAGPLGAFSLIGMLLGVQLLFGALFGSGTQWVAEVAGFAVGFALSFVVSPGGIDRLRAMMRQR